MKPLKNMFPASEGSEKWYSVNGSVGQTKTRQSWMSGDKTPVKSAILNRFDFVPKIVELANYKKNINIKANDVNLISMARNTDFCFKTTYISVFFVLQINHMLLSLNVL